MNSVKFIAKILQHISRLLALLYFITFIFALVILIGNSGALFIHDAGKQFTIYLPYSHIPFLLGFYNTVYIWMEFLPVFLLYALFFLLLSYVFETFAQKRLFTHKGYNYLRVFYWSNLTVPVFMLLLTGIFSDANFDSWDIVGLNILLGIFIFFMASIFEQGLKLQDEQDLIF